MQFSDSLKHIAPALLDVQKEVKPVIKDGDNPHFRSKYVTLDALIEYVKPILSKHGLVLVQGGAPGAHGLVVQTTLIHAISGEFVTSTFELPLQKADPQGAGSAITYGKRYGLAAILAISTDDDDDGNKASEFGRGSQTGTRMPSAPATSARVPQPPHTVGTRFLPEVPQRYVGQQDDQEEPEAAGLQVQGQELRRSYLAPESRAGRRHFAEHCKRAGQAGRQPEYAKRISG